MTSRGLHGGRWQLPQLEPGHSVPPVPGPCSRLGLRLWPRAETGGSAPRQPHCIRLCPCQLGRLTMVSAPGPWGSRPARPVRMKAGNCGGLGPAPGTWGPLERVNTAAFTGHTQAGRRRSWGRSLSSLLFLWGPPTSETVEEQPPQLARKPTPKRAPGSLNCPLLLWAGTLSFFQMPAWDFPGGRGLNLRAPNSRGLGLIPGQGATSYMPQPDQCRQIKARMCTCVCACHAQVAGPGPGR